jgi:hypothetical protein
MPVDVIIDDDQRYLASVAGHTWAYVINCNRTPTRDYVILHRSDCPTINGVPASGSRWTDQYCKAVSTNRSELIEWCESGVGVQPKICETCAP